MKELDRIISQELYLASGKTLSIVGMGDRRNLWHSMKELFETELVDYDIRFEDDENVVNVDIIFDNYTPGDIIVNYACHKMWPIGKIWKGKELILVGNNEHHNGDCNPVTSCQQLIDQNELTEVFHQQQILCNHVPFELILDS